MRLPLLISIPLHFGFTVLPPCSLSSPFPLAPTSTLPPSPPPPAAILSARCRIYRTYSGRRKDDIKRTRHRSQNAGQEKRKNNTQNTCTGRLHTPKSSLDPRANHMPPMGHPRGSPAAHAAHARRSENVQSARRHKRELSFTAPHPSCSTIPSTQPIHHERAPQIPLEERRKMRPKSLASVAY